jgi:hypothetical protein
MALYIIEPHINDLSYIYYRTLPRILEEAERDVKINDFNFDNISTGDTLLLSLGFFNDEGMVRRGVNEIKNSRFKKIAYIHKIKNLYEEKIAFCQSHSIDTILTTTPFAEEIEKDSGIKTYNFPYSADPTIFAPKNLPKEHDIGFSGALHAGKKNGVPPETINLRVKLEKILKDRKDLNVFWNGTDRTETRINNLEEYVKKINSCKVWIATTGPAWDVNPRFFEVLFCKTLLLCNKIPHNYYGHFQDGENCVVFQNDLQDFNEKINYCLENLEKISLEGNRYCMDKFSPSNLISNFRDVINKK